MPTLYDARGNPVDVAALTKPPAPRPPNTSPKPFAADPEAVVRMFKAADQGDPRDLHELAAEIRRRDGHMGGQLRNRVRAVARLPFKFEAVSDKKPDVDVAEACQRDLVDSGLFRQALPGMLDATLRGYSVSSLTWETGKVWRPVAAQLEDPRHTVVDKADGVTVRWRDPANLSGPGIDIAPFSAIVHVAGDTPGPLWGRGLQFALAVYYSIKRLGVAAWASFVELYGVPRPVGTYPATWTATQIADFEAGLAAWGHAGYLVLPNGARVDWPAVSSQGASEAAHEAMARWCDEQASKAILGQTMTSDSGSSRSQAEVHERVAAWILEADSLDVVGSFTRDVVRPYVALNYGADAPVPLLVPKIEDPAWREFRLKVLEKLLPLGLTVEASVARDLGGFPAPAEGAEVIGGRTATSDATSSPTTARRAMRAQCQHTPPARPATLAEVDDQDFIDRDGDDAASAWRETMGPLVDAVEGAARDAQGSDDAARYDDFLRRLEQRSADGNVLVRSIAEWTMKARGVGDGTDEVT